MEPIDQNYTPGDQLKLTPKDQTLFLQISKWAARLSIFAFGFLGIYALTSLSDLGSVDSFEDKLSQQALLMVLADCTMVVLFCIPVWFLYRGARLLKESVKNNYAPSLHGAITKIRNHFRLMAILMLIVLAIYVYLVLVGLYAIYL